MSTNDFENSLDVLKILSEALTVPRSLDDGLDQITNMTRKLMDTEQAGFLFRDEDTHNLILRSAVGIEGDKLRVGFPVDLPARLHSILWRLRSLHQINWVDSGIEGLRFPMIVMPITVKGERVGLLVASGARTMGNKPYDAIRRRLFSLIGSFASLVIENSKVYDYLRQHFAFKSQELQAANSADGKNVSEDERLKNLMVLSLNNPTKVVRLLAESFYKELVRAGFNAGHITIAAAQILDCLTRSTPPTAGSTASKDGGSTTNKDGGAGNGNDNQQKEG